MKIPSGYRILVVVATGMLVKPVAERLKADSFQVYVLSRPPPKAARLFEKDFEICQGDVEDLASLQALTEGTGVHFILNGVPKAEEYGKSEYCSTRAIVHAAQMAGLQHISYLFCYAQEENACSPEIQAKYRFMRSFRVCWHSRKEYIIKVERIMTG